MSDGEIRPEPREMELEDLILLDRLAERSEPKDQATIDAEREARNQRVYSELWNTIVGLRQDPSKPKTVLRALLTTDQPLTIHQLANRTRQEVTDINTQVADLSDAMLVVRFHDVEYQADRVALLVPPED